MAKNPWDKIKREISAYKEILLLLTTDELEDLKQRKQKGDITIVDSTVLDLLDKAIKNKKLNSKV